MSRTRRTDGVGGYSQGSPHVSKWRANFARTISSELACIQRRAVENDCAWSPMNAI